MKKMKKLLALLIVISMFSTPMGTAVFASSDLPAETQSDQKTESEGNLQNNANIDVEGTDSVGDILALAISEENEKSEERQKSVNSITGLDFSGNNASVEYQTEENAEIVVAVYDEQRSSMLASGNTDASKDRTVASVTITDDMPQYFVATAFLLDKESHEPLCDSFTTEMYTKDIQDLKNSTTDDYDEDKIVQLEEGNKDTNFAVFNDETKVVTEDSEKNQIKDNGDGTYTITNVDDTLSDLKVGDTIACSYSDGTFLLIKVGSVRADGTTIIVTEDTDAGLTDYFDYVKIEADSSQGEMEVDNSQLEDGVTPASDVQEAGYSSHEASISRSVSYNASKEFESGVKLTGNFTYGFMFTVDVYVTSQYQYLSIKNEVNAGISVDISGKLAQKEIPLGRIEVQPVPCINVGFTPSFVVEASAKIEWSGEISACIGGAYDGNTGFKNLSTWPSCDSSLKMEGKLFIGIKATPYVSFISDKLAKASLSFAGGTEITATNNIYGAADSKLHECTLCLDGKVYAKLSLELEADFLKDKVKKTKSYNLAKIKISDFYYSTDHDEFGWTTCPYISYPVKVSVKDKDGNNITGTTTITVTGKESGKAVKIKDKTSKSFDSVTLTDSEEKTVYLPNGTYVVHAVNGDLGGESNITVDGRETYVIVKFGKGAGTVDDTKKPSTDTDTDIDTPSADTEDTSPDIASGVVNAGVTWRLTEKGTLYIDGEQGWGMNEPYNVSNISWYRVRNKIRKVIIKKGIIAIGRNAFNGCYALNSIEIPNSVTSIGSWAFSGCYSLSSIEIPSSITSIDSEAFSGCSSLSSIKLSEGLETIGTQAFSGCSSLSSIEIPNSVTSIRSWAFSGCSSLSSIKLPKGLKRIDNEVFKGCSGLRDIYFKGNKPNKLDANFLSDLSNTIVCYPQNDTTWSDIGSDSYGGTNIKWVAYDPSTLATASVDVESTGNAVSAEDLFDESGVASESQAGISDFSDDASDSESEISEADVTIESEDDSDSFTETPLASNDDTVFADETAEDDFNSDDMVVNELTPSVSNVQVNETSGSSQMFSNLVPFGRYLFVMVKDENAEDFLAASNLLYISQKNADEKGTVSFSYVLRENCESSVARIFGVQLKDISGAEVTLSETAYTYDGTARTPAVTVKMDSDILKNDTDYIVEYANNVNPGTATVTVIGKGSYTGSVSVSFTIKPQSAKSDNTIKAFDITKNVSKKAQTVNIKASTLGGAKLTYSSGNKSVKVNAGGKITIAKNFTGKAVITITAAETAKYRRTSAKITVTVRPTGTSLTKLTNNAKGKLKIRWKRNKSVTGYMIQYSIDKNFRKSVKTVNIRKNKTTSTILAKLKKGKTYYVRIATYKKSGGKICSSWSKVKKIRIKK